ncbi:MAG: YlxR family protein [Chloroflexi bacterium]|nr:YlxR family protein [Chloroflexota bacterium]
MAAKTAARPRAKHVPLRTCVACRRNTAKRELVRVVRTVEGGVEVDATGKKAGRGAYLCRDYACWEAALKKDRLDFGLRATLTAEHKQNLMEYAKSLRDEEKP